MSEERPVALDPTDASMHDMLRILDVASTLRREREQAEAQLDLDTAKARLRERLLATAQAAGEPITAAEVDTAIAEYFRRQHEFRDPPRGWASFVAHLWVLRGPVLLVAALLVLVTGGILAAANAVSDAFRRPPPPARAPAVPPASAPAAPPLVAPSSPAPAPAPTPVQPLAATELTRLAALARGVAADDVARQRIAAVVAVGETAAAAGDAGRLQSAERDLRTLLERLEETYAVTIVTRPDAKSGIDRYDARGRLSGYYAIVEAIGADGRAVRRTIRNAETQRTETVTQWGEQVPEAVWQRLVADKQADGVLDETAFAEKRRGYLDETVVLPGADGQPLRRGRQITRW